MPTYEDRCPEGHSFDLFQKMSDEPVAECPVCGRPGARMISGGAGLVFKGSGFYITDYGKDGKGPRKAVAEGGEKPAERSADKPAAESKPAAETRPSKGDKAATPGKSADKPAAAKGKKGASE